MDRDKYEGLIRELEAESENQPAAFRAKVMFISVAAYVVLALLLIGIAALLYWGWSYAIAHQRGRMMIYLTIFTVLMIPVVYVCVRLSRAHSPANRRARW